MSNDEITVVHNGVSGRFGIKPSIETIYKVRKQLSLDSDFFLFLGNVEPRKNVNNTVKAFVAFAEINAEVKLVITGIKPSFVADILYEIGKISYLNRFVFAGFVAENVLLTLYAEAKVFLYPSLREGFGLPILEAMTFGTPVVTSNISAMPEVAGDAAFLVNPFSIKEITNAMTIAYKNDALRNEKIALGYLRPNMFTWQKTAEKMLNIYKGRSPEVLAI